MQMWWCALPAWTEVNNADEICASMLPNIASRACAALPSVVGGLVTAPVVAVPTSVGKMSLY